MITVILVSHGKMVEGILQSMEMLIGEQENVIAVTFEPEDGPDDLTEKVKKVLLPALEQGEAIVMTDIPNGTPFNCVSRLLEHLKFQHLTGMNLPMVIDVVSQKDDAKAEELCNNTISVSREAIINVNAWMKELGIIE